MIYDLHTQSIHTILDNQDFKSKQMPLPLFIDNTRVEFIHHEDKQSYYKIFDFNQNEIFDT